MADERLVYSTDGTHTRLCPRCGRHPCVCPASARVEPRETTLRVRLEKKGRGGKAVTVVYDLPDDRGTFEPLARKLRGRLGTGGTFRGASMEFQGDHRAQVKTHLEGLGFRVKLSGG